MLKILQKCLLKKKNLEHIQGLFENTYSSDDKLTIKQQLIEKLLDQHGTGRILFRNSRSTIKRFSKKKTSLIWLRKPLHRPFATPFVITTHTRKNREC